jgi:probable HAF family extracellular repeat protein
MVMRRRLIPGLGFCLFCLLLGAPTWPQKFDNGHRRHHEKMGPFSVWSEPVNLGPSINTQYSEFHSAISEDELTIFFSSDRPGGFGRNDLWVAERPSRDDDWGPAQNLGPKFNTSLNEACPALSPDGHWLFFCSNGRGGFGSFDIFASFREDTSDNFGWGEPINLGNGVNSEFEDDDPTLFVDPETGTVTMYFASRRPTGLGELDIYMSTLGEDGNFGPAVLVPELSSPQRDAHPSIRCDGLEIFLSSNRPGSVGGIDLWVSTRPTTHDAWSTPVNLGPTVNTEFNERAPYLSADGQALFFMSDRPGGFGGNDFYVTTRTRLCDDDEKGDIDHGCKETFATIDFPGAIRTVAYGINAWDDVVGQYLSPDGKSHGFLLSEDDFTSFDFPGAIFTEAIGINPRGEIVGRYDNADGKSHGYLLSRGEFTTIDFPGSTLTFAAGINAAGEIVGRYRSTDGKFHAFLLSGGQFTSLDFPGAITTFGFGINPRGDTTGDYASADGRFHGFLLSEGQFTSIDFPGSILTFGRGINPQGEIVGRYDNADGKSHGYLLRKGNLSSIDFPSALFTAAIGINPRGDIVGFYRSADGVFHGYLLTKGEPDEYEDK